MKVETLYPPPCGLHPENRWLKVGRTLGFTGIEAYRKAYFATLLGVSGIVAVYLVGQSFKLALNMASNLLIETLALLLFISAFLLAKRYGWSLRGVIPKIWVAASFSAMLIFTAVTVSNIQVYVGGISFPHPSAADLLLLSALCLSIYALSAYVIAFKEALKGRIVVTIAASIVSAGLAVAYFVIYPILLMHIGAFEKILTVTFILLELTLFSLAITGLGIFIGGRFARAWLFLSLGITLLIVGNLIFFYTAVTGLYHAGSLENMCFASGLVFAALAFHIHKKEI